MGVYKKASVATTTIKITKKSHEMIRRYARKVPKKTGGHKYESDLEVIQRFFEGDNAEIPKRIKPLHDIPTSTYNRFTKN